MQAHQTYPALSIRHLCALLEVNRAWYYANQHEQTGSDPDVALRDAIELIVLEFAGYGYRRVTHTLKRSGGPGQSQACLASDARRVAVVQVKTAVCAND